MEEKDIILKVENISKQYRLGTIGTGTLSHDLNRWWHQLRGKEDPYLKVGETNDRTSKGSSEYVWALQDINFEVKRGEVLGIIGKNGAGKSTLLKILSKVTAPTTGTIKSRGRIASLLEVGTGFNPELTGRENIYLNGAILGMTKQEITSKLDEIIAFSGCERYIDTPTKRYSSGMTVRLAFAVAAFLEPEILVVDEVLAVGDAEFQKKAIGKMQDISRSEGRTVLFVSHNMAAVKSLCTKGLLINNGQIDTVGNIDTIIERYINLNTRLSDNGLVELERNNGSAYVKRILIEEQADNEAFAVSNKIKMGSKIRLTFDVESNRPIASFKSSVLIKNSYDYVITSMRTHEMQDEVINFSEKLSVQLTIDDVKLMPGEYFITIGIADSNGNIDVLEKCHHFTVFENDVFKTGRIPRGNNIIYSEAKWAFS